MGKIVIKMIKASLELNAKALLTCTFQRMTT